MFGLGTPELIVILLIGFFVFGSKKLPEIGAGLGKAIGSFKKGINDIEDAGDGLKTSLPGVKEMSEVREKIEKVKDVTTYLGK